MLAKLVAALLLAVAATGASRASPPPLLGITWDARSAELVRLETQTLEPQPGKRIPLGSGGCAARDGGTACWRIPPWTFSPQRRFVAAARNDAGTLRVVNGGSLRIVSEVRVGPNPLGALAWLRGERVLALEESSGTQNLLVVDIGRRRVLLRRSLGGAVQSLARTQRELVLLLTPLGRIGPARLAVIDATGRLRTVRLDRVRAGSRLLKEPGHSVERRQPGLALDPPVRRAFVVDRELVAEVDLARLEVKYHAPSRGPAGRAKTSTGYSRVAAWLGGSVLAVSGSDFEGRRYTPAGLELVDVRSSRVRKIDPEVTYFRVGAKLLLATGERTGIAAYALDGTPRFRLFEGRQAWVELVRQARAYVGIANAEHVQVVDLTAGRVLEERAQPLPQVLDRAASSWWD